MFGGLCRRECGASTGPRRSLQAPPPSNSSDDNGDLRWLLAVYPGRRLEALADLLTKAGTNCPSPALDAQPVGPEPGAIWYVECKDGWHTYINYGGNPVVMDGKVNVQDMTK